MAQNEDPNTGMSYMQHLRAVALAGVALIVEKTRTYGPSWKRRGGPGAWFTTVRPWDRLEQIVAAHGGDVFAAIEASPEGADGSALGCLRDIRNYTILVEAEMIARGVVADPLQTGVVEDLRSTLDHWFPGRRILQITEGDHQHLPDRQVLRLEIGYPLERPEPGSPSVLESVMLAQHAEPTRDYVDQDTRQPSSLVAAAAAPAAHTGDLGAGPIVDGRYTVLDIGHGADLWHEGLGALPGWQVRHTSQDNLLHDLYRVLGTDCLVASRRLVGGDHQILIRIPGTSGT